MQRVDDPFPAPVVLVKSAHQNNSIAWRVADVAAWLERRAQASQSGSAK